MSPMWFDPNGTGKLSMPGLRHGLLTTASAVIPRLIISTDPGQDVDDATALAIGIVLHKQGKIILTAVVASPSTDTAASADRILLDYAGLTSIPVASRKIAPDVVQSDYMDAGMASFYGYTAGRATYPDPVPTMRAALAAAPDQSVIVACIGPVPDIYDLLQSPGDSIDPRTGTALFQAKVQRVTTVALGGFDPNSTATVFTGPNDFNYGFVSNESLSVVNSWNAMNMPVWVVDTNLGQATFFGPMLSSAAASNPLKEAHDLFKTNNSPSIVDTATRRTRAGWDPMAVTLATGLNGNFSLIPGNMAFSTTNATFTFTKAAGGNWQCLKPLVATQPLADYHNALLDAYDQGPTAPASPTYHGGPVQVTEAQQGLVKVAVDPQFFTTFTYATDGATYNPLPAGGITTLTPGTAYSLTFKGSRYGLTSPASTPVAITTKAVTAPTSLETVPGILRDFDFTTSALMLPNPVGNGRITSVADTAGSPNALAPDGTQGPIFVTASTFGAARSAIRSVNGDAAGGNITGAYARLFGNIPELAGKQDFAVFLTASVNNDRNDNGRILSFASGGNLDYQPGGFFLQVPSSNRATISLASGSTTAIGGVAALTHDTPMLLAAICTAGQMQLWVNGVVVGSSIAMSAVGSAPVLGISRAVSPDTGEIFGDYAGCAVLNNSPTTANRQYVEGKMAWNATGDGSLLPAGHPYKTVHP